MFLAEVFVDFRFGEELFFARRGYRGQFHGHAAKLSEDLRYNSRFMFGSRDAGGFRIVIEAGFDLVVGPGSPDLERSRICVAGAFFDNADEFHSVGV